VRREEVVMKKDGLVIVHGRDQGEKVGSNEAKKETISNKKKGREKREMVNETL